MDSNNKAKLTFLNTTQIKLVVLRMKMTSEFCTFRDILIKKNSLKIFKTSGPPDLIIGFVIRDWIAQIK